MAADGAAGTGATSSETGHRIKVTAEYFSQTLHPNRKRGKTWWLQLVQLTLELLVTGEYFLCIYTQKNKNMVAADGAAGTGATSE